VIGLGAAAAAWPGSQATTAARWADRPIAIPAAPAPARPDIAACASADLSVSMVRRGLIGVGTYAYIYRARNVSGRPCFASGYPGVRLPDARVAKGPNVLDVTAGALAPGASAAFAVTQAPRPGCAAAAGDARPVTPRITVGSRDRRAAAAGTVLISRCTATSVTPMGLAQPTAARPDPLSALTVTLDTPARAAAGHTLHFTVTIANPTGAAIRLSPCPGYEIGLSSAHPAAYRLNCSQPVIPAHQHRTFDMQYSVPAGTHAGPAKFGWFLLNPGRTGVGGAIQVTG